VRKIVVRERGRAMGERGRGKRRGKWNLVQFYTYPLENPIDYYTIH